MTANGREKMSPSEIRAWLVRWRSRTQQLNLNCYEFGSKHPKRAKQIWQVYNMAASAGFSLWRAVFLVHPSHTPRDGFEGAMQFTKSLIETNTINFTSDQKSGPFMASYYVVNATGRIQYAFKQLPHFQPFIAKLATSSAEKTLIDEFGIAERTALTLESIHSRFEDSFAGLALLQSLFWRGLEYPSLFSEAKKIANGSEKAEKEQKLLEVIRRRKEATKGLRYWRDNKMFAAWNKN